MSSERLKIERQRYNDARRPLTDVERQKYLERLKMIQFLVTFTTNQFKDNVTCQLKVSARDKLDATGHFNREMEFYKKLYPNFLFHLISVELIHHG